MPKVTSKLQITLPKRLAEQYRIAPGDEIEFVAAGDAIRLVPGGAPRTGGTLSREERLRLFDEATARQRAREAQRPRPSATPAARDWSREDLYDRGKPR